MTDLLSIGASGLRAYRTSLAAVGDNIANAQTIGYARRTVALEEIGPGGQADFRYRNQDRFDGVDVDRIVRASDTFRTAEARSATSAHGAAEAASTWMSVAEDALGDDDGGVGASLANLFATGATLTADPDSRQPRAAFLSAVAGSAAAIRDSAAALQRAGQGVTGAAQAAVDGVNADLATLADLNLAIRRAAPGTSANAALADQRDALVDGIAARIGVTAVIAADGSVALTGGGQSLISGNVVAPLTLTVAADGRLSFGMAAPDGGALAGLASAAATIADRRAGLEGLATDLSTALNNWHAGGAPPGAALLSGDALTLAAALDDPAALSIASTAGANGNALALANVRAASGVEGQWAALVNAQAQSVASARSHESATAARKQTADAARDAVEGVDLDREAADLLRFQQAYEGAARVVQMAKETLDTILRLF